MTTVRTTAKKYAYENEISVPQARRELRAKGAKETKVRRKGGVGFNRGKWYPMIIFEYPNG